MGRARIDVTTLQRNAYFFLKNATPPMQNLEAFREIAELTLKGYLFMRTASVIGYQIRVSWHGLGTRYDVMCE